MTRAEFNKNSDTSGNIVLSNQPTIWKELERSSYFLFFFSDKLFSRIETPSLGVTCVKSSDSNAVISGEGLNLVWPVLNHQCYRMESLWSLTNTAFRALPFLTSNHSVLDMVLVEKHKLYFRGTPDNQNLQRHWAEQISLIFQTLTCMGMLACTTYCCNLTPLVLNFCCWEVG